MNNSWFRDPKKQMTLVSVIFVIWYGILVYKIQWPKFDEIVPAILGLVIAFFRFFGFMDGEVFGAIPATFRGIYLDIVIGVIVFLAGLAFYAQFVLPLHNTKERWHAFTRLITYVIGRHGPAIAIVDGVPRISKKEEARKGSGVILLDTASAAVLRTPTKFTRAVGPGTVFTNRGETIANAFSLHLQSKALGPRLNENPFLEQQELETDQEFKMRTDRKIETRGTTRDGFEVVPTIITYFKLDNKPNEGQTEFGFNANTIWKANGREGIDPKKGEDMQQRRVRWDWLPAFVAVEIWREYLGKFTIGELFAPPNRLVDETGLQRILKFVNARLTEARVEHLNEFGKPSGKGKVISPEYMRLRERGLRVEKVIIANINFPEEVERRILGQWRDRWQDQARTTETQAMNLRSKKRIEGEQTALKDFADKATQLLGDHLINSAPQSSLFPDVSQSLELLVRGTHDQIVMDDMLRSRVTNEKQDLVELIEWIRRH